MRIDKYLANLGLISRKDCKKVIKSENIFLNGQIVLKEDQKIKFWDKIKFFDEEIEYKEDTFLNNKIRHRVSLRHSAINIDDIKAFIEDKYHQESMKILFALELKKLEH